MYSYNNWPSREQYPNFFLVVLDDLCSSGKAVNNQQTVNETNNMGRSQKYRNDVVVLSRSSGSLQYSRGTNFV